MGAFIQRARGRAAIVVAGLVLLGACSSGGTTEPAAAEDPGGGAEPSDADGDAGDGDAVDGDVAAITLAHPCGYPACWFSAPIYIADHFGMFEDNDVEVEIQVMRSGGDIVQAVHTGDVDAGHIGSEPYLVGAPRGLDITGIYGEDNQDWILITRDPEIQGCEDMGGKTSGAQAPGDARWLVLSIILDSCGVSIDDVDTVDTSADNLGPLVGGVLDTHVVHLDELAEVRFQTDDDWRILERLGDVEQLHYTMYVAGNPVIDANREGLVRMVTALAEAAEFMNDPANEADIVEYLTSGVIPQTDPELTAEILGDFLEMEQWAIGEPGLDEQFLTNSIELQAEMGNIPEAYPASDLIDTAIWEDAWARVEERRG